MDKNASMIIISYLLVGFLIILLIRINENPGKSPGVKPKKIFLHIIILVLFLYVLPLITFLSYNFIKVVLFQKYTLYQFREYMFTVLFDEFNGFYVGIWDRIRGLFPAVYLRR